MSENDSGSRTHLGRIGRTAAEHRRIVFVGVLVLLGVSLVGAAGLQMSLGMELYVDGDSQTMDDWGEIQADFDKGNVVFVVVETDDDTDLYDPETQEQLSELYQSYYDEVDSAALVTSPVHPVKAGPGGGEVPETKEEVLYSLNYSYNEHRSNMGVIANLHPGIQATEQYPAVPDDADPDAYPIAVEDGEAMFDGGDTGIIIVQYGDVEIPDDRDGELFGLLPPSEDEIVEEQLRATTDGADLDGMDVTLTGTPVFEEAAFGMMLPEMLGLFVLALAIILALVGAIMRGRLRKTRRVALPLGMALTVVVTMLGMMGFVGFAFNAIMLGVMPIALGLAIDYGLQIQTRYVEERERGRSPIDSAEIASRTTGRALAIVLGTTAVGLGSLFIADVPPVRQFGVTVVFSVLVAMVLSITMLIALLVTFDGAESDAAATENSVGGGAVRTDGGGSPTGLEWFFDRLAVVISARSLLIVLVLGAAVGGGVAAYPAVDTKEDMLDYWPDIEERQDIRELEATVPSPNINYVIIETEDAYTHENFQHVRAFQDEIERHEHVVTVMSPARAMEVGAATPPASGPHGDAFPEPGAEFEDELDRRTRVDRPPQLGLTPADHPDRVVVQVFVEDIEGETEREVIDDTNRAANATLPAHMESRVTGEMVLNRNVIENVTSGLTRTTLLSFGLGALFLGLVLRSGRESVLLIGSVAGGTLALTAGGMYLLGVPWNPLTVTTAAIILGIGIDYAVHIYERFREETGDGVDPREAMRTAIVQKSRPVLGSGATTMLGFGVLITSEFPVLANFGVAIALAMGMAILTAFVLMPAVSLVLARRGYLPVRAEVATGKR